VREALRTTFGVWSALGSVGFRRGAAAAEPDFGRGNRVVATGFESCSLPAPACRYVIAMTVIAGAGFAVVAVSSS